MVCSVLTELVTNVPALSVLTAESKVVNYDEDVVEEHDEDDPEDDEDVVDVVAE